MLAIAQPLAVLLQQQFNNPPPPGPGFGGMELGVILLIYGGLILVSFIINIFFLLTLSNCFREISPKNRQMEPGMVWLILIPIFGLIWFIITLIRLSDSLKDEYEDRGLQGDGDFGKTMGIIYVVSAFVCGCIAPIFYILYWIKVAGYTRELRETARDLHG